jgi:hypothetical protein
MNISPKIHSGPEGGGISSPRNPEIQVLVLVVGSSTFTFQVHGLINFICWNKNDPQAFIRILLPSERNLHPLECKAILKW